jgi:hypothetical protein
MVERVKVILTDLPHSVNAFTVYYFDDEAYYTMFINSRISQEAQFEAYKHEIAHIDNGDFSKMIHASELEKYAHAG